VSTIDTNQFKVKYLDNFQAKYKENPTISKFIYENYDRLLENEATNESESQTSEYPDLVFLGEKVPTIEKVSHRDFDNYQLEKLRV
jgi:hypothetical protein